jgi:hypothetical protein
MTQSRVEVFGIRHHGPGSAQSLLQALRALDPDAVLVEGPPEAEDLLQFVNHPQIEPPVALMVYVPDESRRAVFYPFATFSPEWQALSYGIRQGCSVRFMDLPQRHWLAMREQRQDQDTLVSPRDPFDELAQIAGYEDSDRWWEHLVEDRGVGQGVFAAILEMMTALRAEVQGDAQAKQHQALVDPLGQVREAAMRAVIRAAQEEGFERIAVVCGAYHAPALVDVPPARKEDAKLLKGLPAVKVNVAWVPWSYGHLARESGYGAGVASPGWYEHLWTTSQNTAALWLGRVARLLRGEDIDASAAQVIDALRLCEALSALRGRSRPGLQEMNEVALSVFCFGNSLPLEIIRQKLIVGERLGQVPPDVPAVPLQQDLVAQQRRLRLRPQAEARQYDLDLREPNGLARSHLLHRLSLLGVPWGRLERVGRQRGTFHEIWSLQWDPTFAVMLVEAAVWGNTVVGAATALAWHRADTAPDLAAVTALLEQVLLSDLEGAVDHVVDCLQAQTALTGDVASLMDALPALARTLRYGDVRQDARVASLDAAGIAIVVDGLVARICIGLPLACASLDDDAAREMLKRLEDVHASLGMIRRPALSEEWQHTLRQMADQKGLHGLIAGRCCRLLSDLGTLSAEETARRLRLALSPGNDPTQAAAWLEGLLRGSGLLLLHDETLWTILDQWVTELPQGAFITVLPLLRRAFSAFQPAERRQMGEHVRRGLTETGARAAVSDEVDAERADAVLPLLAKLLGVDVVEVQADAEHAQEGDA